MAVIAGVPGIEAWLSVDGKKLPERVNDNEQPGNEFRASKLIEVTAGDKFVLHLKVESNFKLQDEVLAFVITLDGVTLKSPMIRRTALMGKKTWECKVDGEKSGHNLIFRDTTTDGQEGVIRVSMFGFATAKDWQTNRNPLGAIIFSYKSLKQANGIKDCFDLLPKEVRNLQVAVPTFDFIRMFVLMNDIEQVQFANYLSSETKPAYHGKDGKAQGCLSTPVKENVQIDAKDEHALLHTHPTSSRSTAKRLHGKSDSYTETPCKKKSKLQVREILDLTSDTE